MRQIFSRALGPCNNATNLLSSSEAMQQCDKLTLELKGNATTQQIYSFWGNATTRQIYSRALGQCDNATNLL